MPEAKVLFPQHCGLRQLEVNTYVEAVRNGSLVQTASEFVSFSFLAL
jgi:hypothetical protein